MTPKVPPHYEEFRRQQILEAAWKLFGEKGYRATTIRDMAAELGLSTGVIYNYFESKEQIITALQERSLRNNAEMFEGLAQNATARDALTLLFEEYAHCIEQEDSRSHARANLSLLAEGLAQEDLRAKASSIYDLIGKALSEIAEAGVRRSELSATVDPSVFAELMLAVFTGLQVRAALTRDWDYAYYLRECGKILLGNVWRRSGSSASAGRGRKQ
jgi:TetR/AcrR family transcriptional repressor of uid operon